MKIYVVYTDHYEFSEDNEEILSESEIYQDFFLSRDQAIEFQKDYNEEIYEIYPYSKSDSDCLMLAKVKEIDVKE
jgi:hypothetical protein